MKMSNLKLFAAKALSASVAAVLLLTGQPFSLIVDAFAESHTDYSFEDSSLAIHAGNGGLLLNERAVNINGSIYSLGEFTYSGGEETLSISGNLIKGSDGGRCTISDYTDALNENAEYNFTYEGNKDINSSEIDLSNDSFYVDGSVNILHGSFIGEGNITASDDIRMELYGDSTDDHKAVIMSETGDIIVNAANLSFNGIIYAPKGKVEINAKQIDYIGAIYAEKIEINGTSLQMKYMDYLPDVLICKAGNEDVVRVQKGAELALTGFCNYSDSKVKYTVTNGQEQFVTIKDSETLNPKFVFSEAGVYEITLTAERDGMTASDTVKVIVASGAVVYYTSSEDFGSGELYGLNGDNDELKLVTENSENESIVKSYSLDEESGISVKSEQSKSAISSSGDTLNIGFSVTGYGKTVSGNGSDVILVIDNSGSVSDMVPTIKETSISILDFMGPNDRFGIASLDKTNTVLTDSKKALTEAINTYALTGGSDFGNGLKVALSMFDEKSVDRNKYIVLLADGENSSSDDIVAEEMSKLAAEQGVKIYSFEINPFSNNFNDTKTMQQIAIDTNGVYKLCPDSEAISAFMLKMADAIYNLAARNVTFTTTVKNADWLDNSSMEKAPDSVVYNADNSVTLSWNINAFEIGRTDEIKLALKTEMLRNSGYECITSDTSLTYYNDNGEGKKIYIDDVVVGKNDYAASGKWKSSVYDSKKDNCNWSLVKWNADYRGNSSIKVFLSTSNDGTNFGDRSQVNNGQKLDLNGRYIRTEIEMTTSEDGSTPTLYDLTILSDDETEVEKPDEANSISICGAKTVYVGCPLSLWLDIEGKYDNISDIQWNITGNGEISCEEIGQLRRRAVFSKEGEYNITVSAISGGIKSEASVNVTVLPKEKLSQSIGDTKNNSIGMKVSETPDYVTSYTEPVKFDISFENPEQVSWIRVLYSNQEAWRDTIYQAYVDEQAGNTVSIVLPSNNLSNTVITVQAFDWYGNMSEVIRHIRMDRTAPSVTLTSDKNTLYPYSQAVISASASDNDEIASTVFKCGDDELNLDENGQYTFSPTEPGQYVFTYTAVDKAGLETTRSITITVREDTIQPNVGISGVSRVFLGNSAEIKVIVSDGQTGLEAWDLKLDDGTELVSFDGSDGEIPSEYIYTFTPDSVGKYSFIAEASDKSGNVRSAVYNLNCVADEKGPVIKIELSRNEVLAGEQVTVSVFADDEVAVSELHLFVDGTECELSEDGVYVYTTDDSGIAESNFKNVEFTVVAKDSNGNQSTALKTLKVSVDDTEAPVISISGSDIFEVGSENAFMTVKATDNIGVKVVQAYVNDELVALDENNRYYFDTSKPCEYAVRVVSEDSSGNTAEAEKTVKIADRTKPVIMIVKDRSSYNMGDDAVFTVTVNDNYAVDKVEAKWNGEVIESNNSSFEYTVKDLEAGTHEIYVKAWDKSGNEAEKTLSIIVKDTEPPVVRLSSEKKKYAADEKPVINCSITDNVGVSKVEADINGTAIEYDFETGSLILPDKYTPGEKILTVIAYDEAGNVSETAAVTFEIADSSDTINPVIGEIKYIPDKLLVGVECSIIVEATDDSGSVALTLTIGEKELEYDTFSNSWSYIPDSSGEVTLLVHAEDEAGNYAEKEVVLTVYENAERHRIKAEYPKVVTLTDTITIKLSSTDNIPFDETELWLEDQDLTGSLSENSDGTYSVSFTLGQNGIARFKAIGRDSDGYEDTAEFTIQVSSDYQSEIKSEAMQAALGQTSETTLNDELKSLAATFNSAAEAYEYVYNNVAFESYVNSRRGAVGTYELKRGNDFDQASLLIGLLREMGYPARYVNDTVILTDKQVMSLMAMEDYKSAADMLASSGKKAGLLTSENGEQLLQMEETFVQVYVPYSEIGEEDESKKDLGVWVDLDTSIKDSKLTEVALEEDKTNLTEELSSLYSEYDGTEIANFAQQMKGAYNKKTTAYIRDIEQKEFSVLPSSLQYSLSSDTSTAKTFNEIPASMSDTVQFAISNGFSGKNLGTYKISELYGKRVVLQYVGNTGNGTIFDMNKNEIYKNAFLPALTIDGEIVAQYTYSDLEAALSDYFIEPEDEYYFLKNEAWRLGEKNVLLTRITTGGKSEDITDDLVIGNTYSLTFDTGGITGSQINKAINEAAKFNGIDTTDPSNPVLDKSSQYYPTAKTYYDEDKIGSFLDFAGKYYFLMCDAYGTINANLSNVESSQHTKMVITSYNVGVYEDTLLGYATTSIVPGRFEIDVAYNTSCLFSRTGDTEERNMCLFNTAYMESYYEGWIWETLLYQSGVSTVSIINDALELGADLVFIDSSNIDETLKLVDVTEDEKSEIMREAANGRVIIVPDKRIKVNEWSGTGYIIADFENFNSFVFKVSGGINGGSGTTTVDLEDVKAFTSEAIERTFEASFVMCQSMYFYLLETTMSNKVMPAAEACVNACESGSEAAIAATGIKLYNEVSGLAGILEYRVKMLDYLYEYACGDEYKATSEILTLLVDMVKKVTKLTASDARKSFLKALGFSDEDIELDKFDRNIRKLIDKYLDTNLYQDDWFDKATETPKFA